jgi:hypothetical protein
MAKKYVGFRFEPSLYGDFKKVAKTGGLTATGAFERFMTCCVDSQGWFFLKSKRWILMRKQEFWLTG